MTPSSSTFLACYGQRGGIKSEGGEISDAKNTLKPEELHWVEGILPTLVVGAARAVIGALVNVVLYASSAHIDSEIRPCDVGERTCSVQPSPAPVTIHRRASRIPDSLGLQRPGSQTSHVEGS